APDLFATFFIRKWKVDYESHSPHESMIQTFLEICCQDDYSVERLDSLQQVSHLKIGVSVVTIPHFTSFPKKRICFIKEQNALLCFCSIKDMTQILLCLSDVLAGHH